MPSTQLWKATMTVGEGELRAADLKTPSKTQLKQKIATQYSLPLTPLGYFISCFNFSSALIVAWSLSTVAPYGEREQTHTHTHNLGLCVLAVAMVLWVIWSNLAEVVPTRLNACREQTGTNDLHTHITQRPYVSTRCH